MKLFKYMLRAFVISIFVLGLTIPIKAQSSPFRIEQDSKGTYSLINTYSGKVVFKKCQSIDSMDKMSSILHDNYRNFLFIRKKKKLIVFDRSSKGETVANVYCKDEYQIKDIFHNRVNRTDTATIVKRVVQINTTHITVFLNLETSTTFELAHSAMSTFYVSDFELIRTSYLSGLGWKSQILDLSGGAITNATYQRNLIELDSGFVCWGFRNKSSISIGSLGFGIVNKRGEQIVPYIYDKIKWACKGYLIVTDSNSNMGVINDYGKIIVPFKYYSISRGYSSNLYSREGVFCFKTKTDNEFVVYDEKGNVLFDKGELARIQLLDIENRSSNDRYFVIKFKDSTRSVLYDARKKKTIHSTVPYRFDLSKRSFHSELGYDFILATYDGKMGLLDLDNEKVIIPFEYDSDYSRFINKEEAQYFLLRKNGLYGAIDFNGSVKLPFVYDAFSYSQYGDYLIVKLDGLYGLLDAVSFEILLQPKYMSIDSRLNISLKENGAVKKGVFKNGSTVWH